VIDMSKDSFIKALLITAIIAAITTFIFSPKTLDSNIVFLGFSLTSAFWIISLLKSDLKPYTWYLSAMGLMLFSSYNSIHYSLTMSWIAAIFFIIYTFAFLLTFEYQKLFKINIKMCD